MNYRYPIAPPATPMANAFVVRFDYLPVPLHVPLTAEEESDLYTTRITVSPAAALAGADRIAHVFPRANVRFVMTDPGGLTAPILAQRYLDAADTDPLPIRGAWIALARPADVKDIRTASGNELFPTAVIYHRVIVDRGVVKNSIVPLLQQEKVTTIPVGGGDPVDVPDILTKLTIWLNGGVKVSFPDVDNLQPPFTGHVFEFPQIPMVPPVRSLSVSAVIMEGTGIEADTLNKIMADLRAGATSGRFLRDAKWTVFIPFSYIYLVLPPSELAASHASHPIASGWPALPAYWSVLVFSLSGKTRGSITELNPDHLFQRLDCAINGGPEFPVPRTGLFFFRTNVPTNQVNVFERPAHEAKNLSLYTRSGAPLSATTLSIPDSQSQRGVYRLIVGATPSIAVTSDHYFDVPRDRDHLQQFIDAVSVRHMSSLTTAGSFARTMGYIAEMVVNWLETHQASTRWTPYKAKIPPSASFQFVLASAFQLLVTDDHKTTGDSSAGADTEVISILNNANLDFAAITRPEWMNTHEDGEPGTGWKVFKPASFDASGRKDHFLFNAVLRLDSANASYHAGLLLFNQDEDVENDKAYNQKGEEFAEWGESSEYRPELVETWILTNLVERATL